MVQTFDEFRGWTLEKGKRGPNDPKVTLFTIGTDFLASRLNVTINERNILLELKKKKIGGPSKGLHYACYFYIEPRLDMAEVLLSCL